MSISSTPLNAQKRVVKTPSRTSSKTPLVTILVNNYNYGRFLTEAIDSALNQTYPHTEIIVVDDGSTDHSRDIIASYGDAIIPILKPNGGQASAFNAGFAASHGELICFLDADDVFLPTKVQNVVSYYGRYTTAALLVHQLRTISATGELTGRPTPRSMLSGNLRDLVTRSGGWWPHPPTTGLVCSRHLLEAILPVPEEDYRLCADEYVAGLAPFVGNVAALHQPLAHYRQHGENYWATQTGSSDSGYEIKANRYALEFDLLKEALKDRLGLTPPLSLHDHFPYLLSADRARKNYPSLRLFATLLRCPTLSKPSKAREFAKIVIDKRP